MSLIRRTSQKKVRASVAASMLDCSPKTVKNLIGKEIRGERMGKGTTSPWLVYESDVLAYRDKRIAV